MPIMKPISGHNSVKNAVNYCTKRQRALAADYVNCCEVNRHGERVWEQMDSLRHACGNDRPIKGKDKEGNEVLKRARTYEHIILSPDPRDRITLEGLRSITLDWVEKHFGSYQCAIYYHDDNDNGIMHAHIIVNNTNVETGRRVSREFAGKRWHHMVDDLQSMAHARGLRSFLQTSENRKEAAEAAAETKVSAAAFKTAQRDYGTKIERDIEASGRFSWKADIRQRIRCAYLISADADEFLEACSRFGLAVNVSKRKRKQIDWVFTHPVKETWRVSGARLGSDWSYYAITRRLTVGAAGRRIPSQAMREALLKSVERGYKENGPTLIGITEDAAITAKRVADMLALCAAHDIRALEDFDSSMADSLDRADALQDAKAVAAALEYLPAKRDKVFGARNPWRAGEVGGSADNGGSRREEGGIAAEPSALGQGRESDSLGAGRQERQGR